MYGNSNILFSLEISRKIRFVTFYYSSSGRSVQAHSKLVVKIFMSVILVCEPVSQWIRVSKEMVLLSEVFHQIGKLELAIAGIKTIMPLERFRTSCRWSKTRRTCALLATIRRSNAKLPS